MVSRKVEAAPILVTGTSGFIGGHLIRAMQAAGTEVRLLPHGALERNVAGESELALLRGCGSIVHLAARAHVLEDTSASLLDVYRQANRDTTLKLARAAANTRVARFVFVSSIRVNGSSTSRPFRADDPPSPDEPYAISKYEAELGLWQIAHETGLEVVVIRPPLVYGPGVKANFRRLLQLAASGLPLPLASVEGRRSLIGVRNLCDLLLLCTQHENARGRTFLAADGEDISLPSLICRLAAGMGRTARLVPMPPRLLRALAALLGKTAVFDKLTASLQVDASETFAALRWRPPVPLAEGLRETARWFAETRGARGDGDRRGRGHV